MTSKTGFTKRSTPVYHPMNSPSTVPSTTARTKPTDATVMLERMFIPSVEPSGFGSVIFSAKVCRICTGDGKYRVEIRPHSTTSAQTAINSTTVRADAIAKRFLLKKFSFFMAPLRCFRQARQKISSKIRAAAPISNNASLTLRRTIVGISTFTASRRRISMTTLL